jgi:hypothetical protein
MKIFAAIVLLMLIYCSIGRVFTGGYHEGRQGDDAPIRALQRAAGRVNYLLGSTNGDYEIVRHWVQVVVGRNYWLWLKDRSNPNAIATVKLYEYFNGKVRVIRAVRGF